MLIWYRFTVKIKIILLPLSLKSSREKKARKIFNVLALSKAGLLVNGDNTTWIGLHTPTNGSDVTSYKWIDRSLTNYTKCAPNEPDRTSEKCVHIVLNNITNQWAHAIENWNNVVYRFHLRNFVCKKKANVIQYSY